MLGNLGLHIEQYSVSGKFGFIGDIPANLCTWGSPTRADVLAGRAVKCPDGEYRAPQFPRFDSAEEAVKFAQEHNAALCSSPRCMCRKLFTI